MKYIVDFIDTTSEEEINAWLALNSCEVVKHFSHFSKTYLVSTTKRSLKAEGIVERVHTNSATAAVKLLDTYVAPTTVETISIDTTADQNWWKTLVFQNAVQVDTATVTRIGVGYPVYVMDSGIKADHPDLANASVRNLFSFTGDFGDTKGHGTAIASLVSGSTAGISSAEVINVKIFQTGTPTLFSDLLDGLDAIAADYIANYPNVPGILNLSWGIEANEFVESKILALINLGIVVVAAAGNSGLPIGDVSPARMPEVLTIGSINTDLEPSAFSNYTGGSSISYSAGDTNHGAGLDYWAPGELIWVADINTNGFSYAAGTSMASGIFAATLVHNLARHNFMYDMDPITWNADNSIISIMTGATQDNKVISSDNIKSLIANSSPSSALILPYQELVVLTEKYAGSTNRVPIIRALTPEQLTSAEDIKDLGSYPFWYKPLLFVNKDEAMHIPFLNYGVVDSVTVDNLPTGLVLDGLYISGTMTEDLGTDKIRTIPVSVHFTKGEYTLDATIFVVYYDRTKIGVDFTEEELNQDISGDSNITLFSDLCFDCVSSSYCAGSCITFYECSAPNKGFYYSECFG